MKTNWVLLALMLAAVMCMWNDLRLMLLILAKGQPDYPPYFDLFTMSFVPHGKPAQEIQVYGLYLLPIMSFLCALRNFFRSRNFVLSSFALVLVMGISFFAYWSLKLKLGFVNPGNISDSELVAWTELTKYSFEATFTRGPTVKQTFAPLAMAYTFFMLVFAFPFYTKKKKRAYHLPPPGKI